MVSYGGMELELIVLKVLSKSPMHGYKLASEVEEIFGKRPSNGALNPVFDKLEEKEMVHTFETVEQGRYKKIYSLSEKGKKKLDESINKVEKFMDY